MKLLKKVLTGALSLVVLAGAVFAFSGCSDVRGKTYAYEGLTYTIITGVDETDPENKKITETKTLTAREYWLVTKKGYLIEELANKTLTEAEEKEFATWYKGAEEDAIDYADKDFTKVTMEFKGKKVVFVTTDVNEEGEGEKAIFEGTYTEKDGVIDCEVLASLSVSPEKEYALNRFYVNNDKIEKRTTLLKAENYAKDALYMINVIYAEV